MVNKEMFSKNDKIINIYWLIGTLALILMIMFLLRACINRNPFIGEDFNRDKWIKYYNVDGLKNYRGPMAENLKYLLLGKPYHKDNVIILLGKPDNIYEDGTLVYYLGYYSGFQIDMDSISISFDETGFRRTVYIRQH